MPNKQETRLAAIKSEMEALLKAADGRALTEDETTQFDSLDSESATLRAELKALADKDAKAAKLAALSDFCDNTPASCPTGQSSLAVEQVSTPPDYARPTSTLYKGRLGAFASKRDALAAGMHLIASMHQLANDGIGDVGAWATRQCGKLGVKLAISHSEGDNARGGFLVHDTMETAIEKLRNEYGVVRREFAVKTMTSDTHSWPREVGSHTVYYPEENGEITASAMKWGQASLTAKKMAALAKFSSELNEDAVVDMAVELADNMAWKFSYAEDLNGFVGDGTATYGGMTGIVTKINDASGVTYAGSIYTAITGNTAFSTLDLADFCGMLGKCPKYALPNAKWYISRAGWADSMLRLLLAAGGATTSEIAGGAGTLFLGYPVVFTDVMNSTLTAQTSTAGLVLFGDLRKCAYLGDRRRTAITSTTHRWFENDQIGIKATQRVGITCYPGDPEAPTTAAGPVIMLSTPGS